jgi:hypothetical protein
MTYRHSGIISITPYIALSSLKCCKMELKGFSKKLSKEWLYLITIAWCFEYRVSIPVGSDLPLWRQYITAIVIY